MDEPRTPSAPGGRLVVVGGGMVAHRLVEALTDRDDATARGRSTCSPRSRARRTTGSALTSFFSGRDPDDLLLGEPGLWRRDGRPAAHQRRRSSAIDTERREVHARGRVFGYDALVLATGSSPAVPPVPGQRPAGLLRLPHRRRRLRAARAGPRPAT